MGHNELNEGGGEGQAIINVLFDIFDLMFSLFASILLFFSLFRYVCVCVLRLNIETAKH